jgi:hypothetical protein
VKVPAMLHGTAAGACVGFMLRPCCSGPALLSLFGAAGSSAAMLAATHRGLLLAVSTLFLIFSAFINFRRSGGALNKALVVVATCAAFFMSARTVGVL